MPFHVNLPQSVRLSCYCIDIDMLFKSLNQSLGGITLLCNKNNELQVFRILGFKGKGKGCLHGGEKEQRRENVRGSQSHCGEVKHVVLCCCLHDKRHSRAVGKSV